MIRRILLDLDDVCNRLTMHILWHVGCDVDPMTFERYPVECQYDIVCAANKLFGYERFYRTKSCGTPFRESCGPRSPPSSEEFFVP